MGSLFDEYIQEVVSSVYRLFRTIILQNYSIMHGTNYIGQKPAGYQEKSHSYKQPDSFSPSKAYGYPLNLNHTLKVNKNKINRTVQIYTWRSKTSLPIIKVQYFKISPLGPPRGQGSNFTFDLININMNKKGLENQVTTKKLIQFMRERQDLSVYEVTAKTEQIQFRLSELQTLPFPQTIHLLKEILVGYEVLLDIFGFFEPSDRMITVNSHHQWKIWVNEDFRSNEISLLKMTTQEFITKILEIVQVHTACTNLSRQFFIFMNEELNRGACTFLKVLERVKEFAKIHKILQVNRVTLPACYLTPKTANNFSGSRLKTENAQMGRGRTPKTPDIGSQVSSKAYTPISGAKPGSSEAANFSQLEQKNISWQFFSAEISKQNMMKYQQMSKFKHRPSFNLVQKHVSTPRKKYMNPESRKNIVFCKSGEKKEQRKSKPEFLESKEWRLGKLIETPKSKANIASTNFKPSVEFPKIKSLDKFYLSAQKAYTPPKDIASHEQSITFSGKNSEQNVNLLAPNTILSNPSINDIACNSHNHTSSTKELRNSSEVQPDLTSYAKLKEKDLKNKARNNYSTINNNYKIQEKPEKEDETNRKNLTVSHQFHNRQVNKLVKTNEKQMNNWTSTITGLFDDTKSIKCLKESIKFKGKDDDVFEKQHLKDVKLDLLQKFGRKVEHIEVDDETHQKRKKGENIQQMGLIQQQLQDIKSYIETSRKEDDITRSIKSIKKLDNFASNKHKIAIKQINSQEGNVSDRSEVLYKRDREEGRRGNLLKKLV